MTDARPDTWMPLYWGDYMRDTMHLTTEEHGAYLLLIAHYWTSGEPLPNDPKRLANISRMGTKKWNRIAPTILDFFTLDDGVWRHGRIDDEIGKAKKAKAFRVERAKKGAAARHGNEPASSKPQAVLEASTSPPPPPSPSENPNPPPSKTAARDERVVAIVERFNGLRASLWPNWPGFAAPSMTLETEARAFLDQGGTVDVVCECLEYQMGRRAETGQTPPNSINAFRVSIGNTIARTKANGGGAPRTHSAGVRERPAFLADRIMRNEYGNAAPPIHRKISDHILAREMDEADRLAAAWLEEHPKLARDYAT